MHTFWNISMFLKYNSYIANTFLQDQFESILTNINRLRFISIT